MPADGGERRTLGPALALTLAQGYAAVGAAAGLLVFSAALGPDGFGRASLLLSIAMLGSLALTFNHEGGAARALAGAAPDQAERYARRCRGALCLGGGISVLALAGAVSLGGLTRAEACVLWALMMALAALRVTARQATVLGHPLRGAIPRLVARPTGFLVGAGAIAAGGLTAAGPLFPATAFLAATVAGFGLQSWLLRARLPVSMRCEAPQGPDLRFGLSLAPSVVMMELHRPLVLTAAALVLTEEALGRLAVAFSLAMLAALPVIAVEMVVTGRISSAHARRGARGAIGPLRQAIGLRWVGFGGAAAVLLGTLPVLERLLGPGYAMLQPMILWLLLPAAARAAFGNPVLMLTLCGAGTAVGRTCLAGVGLSIAGAIFGGAVFGATGAAAGAALAFAVSWAGLWWQARCHAGVDTALARVVRGSASPGSPPAAGNIAPPGATEAAR